MAVPDLRVMGLSFPWSAGHDGNEGADEEDEALDETETGDFDEDSDDEVAEVRMTLDNTI